MIGYFCDEVKVGGPKEKPIDVGLPVVPFHVKGFGRDPSGSFQARDIAVCQLFDAPARSRSRNTITCGFCGVE